MSPEENKYIDFTETKDRGNRTGVTPDEENLTVIKTAQFLNISKTRVFQLIKAGRILPQTVQKDDNGKKYLFSKKYLEKWKENRLTSERKEVTEKLTPLQNKYDMLESENKNLILELGRTQGKYAGIEEQLYKTQHILSERAESLFEKEAKIRELEDKIQKLANIEEEAERAKRGHEEERLKVENERKEKEELMKQLILLNMPWWKKFFHTKEKLEEEIQKKLK